MEQAPPEVLRWHAERFRRAIENCDRSLLPVGFENFPLGSCGDANLLLGNYLAEQGLGDFEYFAGERGSSATNPPTWMSHAWIRQGRTIIDITTDQFPDVAESVTIADHSACHDTFRQIVAHAADYRVYDDHTRSVLGPAYRRIIAAIGTLPTR